MASAACFGSSPTRASRRESSEGLACPAAYGRVRLQPLSASTSKVPGNRQRRREPSRRAGSRPSLQISCCLGVVPAGSCEGGSYLSIVTLPEHSLKFTILVIIWSPSYATFASTTTNWSAARHCGRVRAASGKGGVCPLDRPLARRARPHAHGKLAGVGAHGCRDRPCRAVP